MGRKEKAGDRGRDATSGRVCGFVLATACVAAHGPAIAETIRLQCTGTATMEMRMHRGNPAEDVQNFTKQVTIDTAARVVTVEETGANGQPLVQTPAVAALTRTVVSFCEALIPCGQIDRSQAGNTTREVNMSLTTISLESGTLTRSFMVNADQPGGFMHTMTRHQGRCTRR